MAQIQQLLEGIPGYGLVMDQFNDYAGDHFNTKNPFEDENGNRRRLPKDLCTKKEHQLWKKLQREAWVHDKCFLGLCGVGMDCGLGLVPLAVFLLPGIGPLLMYGIHARLIHIVTNEMAVPNKLVAKMQSQILFDLLISLPPLIGSFFSWLNGCSTRNASMYYDFFMLLAEARQKNETPMYIGTAGAPREPELPATARTKYTNPQPERRGLGRRAAPDHAVIGQQESGWV